MQKAERNGSGAYQVSGVTPAGMDNFKHCVRRGGLHLDLNGQNAEEQDLNGGSGGIPVRKCGSEDGK